MMVPTPQEVGAILWPSTKTAAVMTKAMPPSPRISIITPAYNAEKYVKRVTRSVLSQRNVNFEWIIVDDCSIDNTYDAFRAEVCDDPRIRLIQSPRNGGVSEARNMALANAVGEYVCFLDADDSWAPDKLAVQYEFMRSSNTDVTAMDYLRVDELHKPLGLVRPPPLITRRMMLKSNRIGNLTAMVRRSLLAVRTMSFGWTLHGKPHKSCACLPTSHFAFTPFGVRQSLLTNVLRPNGNGWFIVWFSK
jgi:glycosyltransferase involved in cell wall biosynthesis